MAEEKKEDNLSKLRITQKKLNKKSTVSVLTEDSGYRVDFYIHVYKKKDENQSEPFLQSIEGHVEPGTVCAIVGPRSSGKKRLLALLSGRVNKHVCLGEVHVNNVPYNAPQMRASTSYLAGAGSTLSPQMTIGEAVDFIARLVLPAEVDDVSREEKVNSILKEVGLDKKVDTLIETVTLEDRVRINLAQVLMEGKKIIFLDEPTASLDLLGAQKIITNIIKIAENRLLTMFVSLEHPTKSLLEKFHKCLFLAKGRQLYFGPVSHTVDFFGRLGYHIPEETSIYDHVLALSVPQNSEQADAQEKHLENLLEKANAIFEEIQMAKLNEAQRKDRKQLLNDIRKNNTYIKLDESFHLYSISWGRQFQILFSRYVKATFRNQSAFVLRLFLTGLWVLIFWLLCFENGEKTSSHEHYPENVTDLINAWTLALAGIQSLSLLALPQAELAAIAFHSDQDQNLYRPSTFAIAQLLIGFIVQFILMIFISIAYFLILGFQFNTGDVASKVQLYFSFSGLLLLVAVISEIAVLCVALLSVNHNAMYLVTMFIQFLWVMFSGGVSRFCTDVYDFVSVISWISPSKHALDGLLLLTVNDNVYTGSDDNGIFKKTGSSILESVYCFQTWRHVKSLFASYIALIIFLLITTIALFISARVRQSRQN